MKLKWDHLEAILNPTQKELLKLVHKQKSYARTYIEKKNIYTVELRTFFFFFEVGKNEKNRYLFYKLSQTYGSTISFKGIDEFYREISILKNFPPKGGSSPLQAPHQFFCRNQLMHTKRHLKGSLYTEFEENR